MTTICNNCILGNDIAGVSIDNSGLCNFCVSHSNQIHKYSFTDVNAKKNLSQMRLRIMNRKKGDYDALLGLSGGVDSSFIAKISHELNLNILCIHFDNGWNSNIAVKNIRKIIDKTNYDLITYVINWEEFKDLQRAFLYSGVIDIEMLTDHAIFSSMFKLAKKYKARTILSGTNYRTEHGMPEAWVWNKMDVANINDIHKKFGKKKLTTFPKMSPYLWLLMKQFGIGAHFEEPLNLINYRKNDAIKELKNYFSWEDYGGKHHESEFTKFYQTYILPRKFKIDKRRVHLSDLIRNEELSRESGLKQIKKPIEDDTTGDLKKFVIKKLGFDEIEFDNIMMQQPQSHNLYKTQVPNINRLKALRRLLVRG